MPGPLHFLGSAWVGFGKPEAGTVIKKQDSWHKCGFVVVFAVCQGSLYIGLRCGYLSFNPLHISIFSKWPVCEVTNLFVAGRV